MRQILSCVLSFALPALPAQAVPQSENPLENLVQTPYVELFERASELRISAVILDRYRKQLEEEKEREKEKLERQKETIENRIERSRDQLKKLNRGTPGAPDTEKRRHTVHCRIQELEKQLADIKIALQQGVNIAYDNKLAKLDVLERWPARFAQLQQLTAAERATERKFGNFRDIGFRGEPFNDQADDIDDGQEAIRELERNGLLPPEVEDQRIQDYVQKLGRRIASNSDLTVPLHIKVLKSREINAFALPGGFLFVNTGLIEKAEKESELAGVLAHEIAHVAARHSKRLRTRATIASIIFQAAQVAALIFTGGVVGIGTYYALQYGFYGLGLLLSLELLGVSRDYEIEADILGTQYLWKAGHNTRGFISFFDKMAQEKGYVTGLSWFRTHPPFYERMESTFEEITLLPKQEAVVDDTSEFHQIKERVAAVLKEMEKKDREAPTLKKVYECDDGEDHSKQAGANPAPRALPPRGCSATL